ncbi:hypothetical protein IAQ61_004869 [Plenodomus lingam]|uniref:uncharacterized protein n=1 Tax=Leptosphaeria maculans TaxID=5022 RepID=UPI00332B8E98|nr:hypothetical protein IAQ61_004869 [Plenodomus lingam]
MTKSLSPDWLRVAVADVHTKPHVLGDYNPKSPLLAHSADCRLKAEGQTTLGVCQAKGHQLNAHFFNTQTPFQCSGGIDAYNPRSHAETPCAMVRQ